MIKNTFLLAFALLLISSTVFSQLQGYKIAIDPGHGGTQPGASGAAGPPHEKTLTLNCGLELKQRLAADGATVSMTRTTDATVALQTRRDFFNNVNPHAAISIHLNAYNTTANGTETWKYHNTALANQIQSSLVSQLQRVNRGVKTSGLTVITCNSSIPACLTEGLFVDNPTEYAIITSTSGFDKWVKGHYFGIYNFLGITPGNTSTAPANDNCSNAQTLTSGTSCVATSGTIAGATVSGLSKASCDVSSYSSLKDVWYKFVASSTSHTIKLTPSSGFDGVLALYTSCTGSQIGGSDNGGGPGGVETINATNLTVGNTYYIRIYPYGSASPTTSTFTICVTHTAVSCGTPANLTASNITTSGATLSWSAVSGASSYNLRYKAVSATTWSTSSVTGTSKSVSGLTASTAYEFQVQTVCSGTSGAFTSSQTFTTAANSTAPANDNCSNAQTLTSGTSCVATSGTIAGATVSGLSKASCDVSSYSSLKDVWYKFVASSTSHTIKLTPSSGLDGVLALYTSCTGSQIGCSDNGGGTGGVETINATNLTVGNTYYIRIYPYGSANPTTSTFTICVTTNTVSTNNLCDITYIKTIENFKVYKHNSTGAILFKAKFTIDADGSPRAYGPNNSGLDYTANAGYPGNWWGVVTNSSGNPVIQGSNDPYPGMYVSTTSLVNSAYGTTNPLRYVNSETVPFIALPSALVTAGGIKIGDVAYVYNTLTGQGCYAIYADTGPAGKLGEGSMYLAQQLGINSNPRTGGISTAKIAYVVFPQSGYGQGTVPSNSTIQSIGVSKINTVGGTSIVTCLSNASEREMAEDVLNEREATEEQRDFSNDFIVYPNPSDGTQINVKIDNLDNTEFNVNIYDMTGKQVFFEKVIVAGGGFSLSISDANLRSGYYLFIADSGNLILRKKLIIQK